MSEQTTIRRSPQEYVFVPRPRCPRCESVSLHTIRSEQGGDGSVSRRSQCRDCGEKFILVLE